MTGAPQTGAGPSTAPAQASTAHPRRWWVLAGLVLVVIAFDLNLTMVNIALPTLATELAASSTQLQWISSAFSLMVAATLLPAGMLGDRYGAKRPLIGALVVLAAVALLCTQAGSAPQLITGQLVLGGCAGFIPALSLALVRTTFPREELGRALAIWSIGMTVGIPLGPIVGGLLVDRVGWGGIYLLNVPLVLAGAALLAVLLPSGGGARGRRPDLLGVLLSSAGIVLVSYGFTQAGEIGWSAPSVLVTLGAGAALLVLLVARIQRAAAPIIDPSLFRPPAFRAGVVLSTLVTFTLMGAVFTVPQYLNVTFGAGPLETGVRLLPIVGGLLAGVVVADPLVRVVPRRLIIALGFGFLAAATVLGATTTAVGGYGITATWLAIGGVGIGFAMPSAIATAMTTVPEHSSGIGSGVLQVVRQAGGTLGIALLGTVLTATYRSQLDTTALDGELAAAVERTAASGMAVASETGDDALAESVRGAFVSGMSTTLWISAAIAVVGAVLALTLSRGKDGRSR